MTCSRCGAGAVVAVPMPGAPELVVRGCAACGEVDSDWYCQHRARGRDCAMAAVGRCRDCQGLYCALHGPRGARGAALCDRCRRRLAAVLRTRRTG